eukprot:TRINITY_DN858_c0_g1_i2.p1 TRINITY_DN858_c0_g1~~TRINITY_DN858_c0_g1_i2.p1  ORF type:complete len:586 (-),score=118.12 TRINITY_DN858_c0_g1_i2:990-2747(-)
MIPGVDMVAATPVCTWIGIIAVVQSWIRDRLLIHLEWQVKMRVDEAIGTSNMKSDFFATMNHELRTPLNAILGIAQLLELEGDTMSASQRDLIETLHSSGKLMLTLVNDVLDFSRIEAKKMTLEVIEFDIVSLVDDVVGVVAAEVHRKHLELWPVFAISASQTVFGDPTRLRQVLINLLSNAVKFTTTGEVVLRVSYQSSDTLRFAVEDSGIGLTAEERHALFQPFTQADASTARHFGGTGLGLAICKRLVSLMGGDIQVESVKGQGSKFSFTIPIRAAGAPARLYEEPIQSIAHATKRTLLVSENARSRELCSQLLEAFNTRVETFESFDGAFLNVKQRKTGPSLIVLDYPSSSTFATGDEPLTCIGQIRSNAKLHKTGIVVMVFPALKAQLQDATLDVVGVQILSKPIRPSRLRAAAEAAFSSAQSHATSRPVSPGSLTSGLLSGQRSMGQSLFIEATTQKRILVVEDNQVNQQVARHMLTKLGFTCDIAVDAQNAIAMLQSVAVYDAVMMDCYLPGMDGLEATRIIRRLLPPLCNIPIIAVSAAVMARDVAQCYAAGMSDFLSKPYDIRDLQVLLDKWVRKA